MLIECVPNISEGRDPSVIQAIAQAVESTPGAYLLHRTSDADHNRSVFTFAGELNSVAEAAFRLVQECARLIYLEKHTGVHPRIGAADVVPLVPIEGISLERTAKIACDLGQRIWNELGIPVFLYEAAATREQYQHLEQLRRSVPNGLAPDFGEGLHPTAGAVCVGARKFLIAWNVNLQTTDLEVAKQIAREIRQSSGGFRGLKALGIRLESRGQVQVSMNVVDFHAAPLPIVFRAISAKCRERGVAIAGSELIGLVPEAAVQDGWEDLMWLNFTEESVLENRLRSAAKRD